MHRKRTQHCSRPMEMHMYLSGVLLKSIPVSYPAEARTATDKDHYNERLADDLRQAFKTEISGAECSAEFFIVGVESKMNVPRDTL